MDRRRDSGNCAASSGTFSTVVNSVTGERNLGGDSFLPQLAAKLRQGSDKCEKSNHAADIAFGKSLLFRQFVSQLAGQSGNDGCSPAFMQLPEMNHAADISVHSDEFSIHRQDSASLGLPNACLDLQQQIRVVTRRKEICSY
jgi:hypothetical protein